MYVWMYVSVLNTLAKCGKVLFCSVSSILFHAAEKMTAVASHSYSQKEVCQTCFPPFFQKWKKILTSRRPFKFVSVNQKFAIPFKLSDFESQHRSIHVSALCVVDCMPGWQGFLTVLEDLKLRVTRGRCYDHNFLRFLPICGEKIGVFLKK
jgi:hypothetical protein